MLQLIDRVLDRIRGVSRPDPRFDVLSDPAIFRRPELASRMASALMSHDHASGLFLTAPRRTGKSTFIQRDLTPALEREHGALVLYADLWRRRSEDPGTVIVELINQAVKSHEDQARRMFDRLSLSRLKVPGFEWELKGERGVREPSLCESLERLSDLAKQTVVLIIDEVQQTQSTSLGRDVLYMLKSARDHLNGCDKLKFRLLATGSHHEKIVGLVLDKHQAFLGANMETMPTLGEEAYLRWERALHGPAFQPSLAVMAQAFDICLRRPADFHKLCRSVVTAGPGAGGTDDDTLIRFARGQIQVEKRQLFIRLQALEPIEQVVLRLLAEDGEKFAPFFPPAKRRLNTMLAVLEEGSRPEVSDATIRMALDRLCNAKLMWRGDGPYVLEEMQFATWLLERDPVIVAPAPTSPLLEGQTAEAA